MYPFKVTDAEEKKTKKNLDIINIMELLSINRLSSNVCQEKIFNKLIH